MQEQDFMAAFRSHIADLDQKITDFSENEHPENVDALCSLLVSLNKAKVELSIVYDSLVSCVSSAMAQNPEVMLEDGSIIEKKWANDRKGWRHKDLAKDVSTRLVQMQVDMDTGEVLYTQEQLVSMLLDFVQPSYWRVKELQKIGLNADNYCEVGETKASIIVRKAKS